MIPMVTAVQLVLPYERCTIKPRTTIPCSVQMTTFRTDSRLKCVETGSEGCYFKNRPACLPACLHSFLPSFLSSIPFFVRWWPSCRTSKPSKTTTAYLIPEVAHTWQAGGARDRGEIWRNNRTLQRLPFQEHTALGPHQQPPPTLPKLPAAAWPAHVLLLFAPV